MNGGGVPPDTQASDAEAERAYWASLYEKYHKEVWARLARRVRCPHDVDDLVQEVFASVIGQGDMLRHPQA